MTTITIKASAWQYTTPPFPSTVKQVGVTLPAPTSFKIHIEIRAAALNPVDVQLINSPGKDTPKGIGCDYSGEIIAVGSGIKDFAVGDEVFGLSFDAVRIVHTEEASRTCETHYAHLLSLRRIRTARLEAER